MNPFHTLLVNNSVLFVSLRAYDPLNRRLSRTPLTGWKGQIIIIIMEIIFLYEILCRFEGLVCSRGNFFPNVHGIRRK